MPWAIGYGAQPIADPEEPPMPDPGPPSEFGGKVRPNRVQPPPHEPTASEKLMLIYTTGDETGATDPVPTVFDGLLPETEQEKLRREAGDLDKGQVWREMTGE